MKQVKTTFFAQNLLCTRSEALHHIVLIDNKGKKFAEVSVDFSSILQAWLLRQTNGR